MAHPVAGTGSGIRASDAEREHAGVFTRYRHAQRYRPNTDRRAA